MVGICSLNDRNIKCIHNFGLVNLVKLSVREKIILKWMLMNSMCGSGLYCVSSV
jgi:hypothetical protein